MQKQEPISNQTQIFRHDARGCFVEAKCDRFHLDRVHLQFVAYDKNRPQGQRYTNNVNIYIPIPEFLVLYQEAASGVLHGRMQQYKTTGQQESLYEHMGGTPASTLARLGKARPDGKSVCGRQRTGRSERAGAYRPTLRKEPGTACRCQLQLEKAQ